MSDLWDLGVQLKERLWIAAPASYDLRCERCGASASLPLGMTCDGHRPKRLPPEWMVAASQPCPTCDGGTVAIFQRFPPCPDCVDGKPLIELRVPCPSDYWMAGDCPICDDDGTVSAGVWKVIDGPLRIVKTQWYKRGEPLPPEPFVYVASDGRAFRRGDAPAEDTELDLTHLLPDGGDPASLVGQWLALLERVR